MTPQTQPHQHGKTLGGLVLAIVFGAVALSWAYAELIGTTRAPDGAGFVQWIAVLCAVSAAAATWTLTCRLVGGSG
jgi:hypothetical protein